MDTTKTYWTFLTRYEDLGASSRVRTYQFIEGSNLTPKDYCLSAYYTNKYLQILYSVEISKWLKFLIRIKHLVVRFFVRLNTLLSIPRNSTVYIEKELIPYLPYFLERIILRFLENRDCKLIYDFDDNIFEYYRANSFLSLLCYKKKTLPKNFANYVMCGNENLKCFLEVQEKSILIYSTSKSATLEYKKDFSIITFGWIGTPQSLKNLEPAVEFILDSKYDFIFCGVSKSHFLSQFPESLNRKMDKLRFIEWSPTSEEFFFRSINIGLMPLNNGVFERFKCGYKIIQYMNYSIIPCVSPLGINNSLIENGKNGFLINSNEWCSLSDILDFKKNDLLKISNQARKDYLENYSYEIQLNKWEQVLGL